MPRDPLIDTATLNHVCHEIWLQYLGSLSDASKFFNTGETFQIRKPWNPLDGIISYVSRLEQVLL